MSEAVLIALITGGLTLIGVIITAISGNRSIAKDLKEIKEDNKEQALAILRLTIMNNDMPISERLVAGEKYIKKNGNGDVKRYYEQLIKEHTK